MNQISLATVAESYGSTTETMTSLEISELTGKRHDNVMADIRKMLAELHGDGGVLIFQDTHTNTQNGQSYSIFKLPKRESLILVSGYSVTMRAKIIDRWDALETGKSKPAMVTAQDQGPSLTDASNSIIQMHGAGVIGKREAAAMYRAAMLSKFHGAGALLAASKPKPAKALPAPTQATLTNGESVPYGLRAAGTKSATELLRAHGSAVQAKEFYEVMWSKDMATATRVFENGVGNVTHRILVGDGLKYGQNVMNFDGTHSHPYFYHDKFAALLKRVGLLVDATPKPTASERALRDYKNIVKDAWNTYGCETSESANRDGIPTPYLTRSALINYLTIDMGKSEKTAKNFLAPKSDAMRALFKDGFLSQHQNGWLIFDSI